MVDYEEFAGTLSDIAEGNTNVSALRSNCHVEGGRIGNLLYLPAAQLGLQLFTSSVPLPKAFDFQEVHFRPEMNWLDGMQNGGS